MTARHITTATLALAAVLTAATAAEAQGHRNAAAGYARHMPAQGQAYAGGHAQGHVQSRAWSDARSHGSVRGYVSRSESYSDTGWRGGYGPVETYGGGYAYGAGGAGYAPPVVISHAEPIRGGWGGQVQQSMPFGYPVHGFGRDYSGGAPWTRYRGGYDYSGGYDYGYAGGYSGGYGYSQLTPPVESYRYERRDYVQDRGGRYGYSQGYRECGHCTPPPAYRPRPEPVYAPPPPPVHVRQRPVHVQAPPVYVQAPPVYVEPAPVYVRPSDVYVQAPPVHVAPADVRVAPSRVHVSQGPVHVAPPAVDVAPPVVEFEQAPRPHYDHAPPSGYYGHPDSRPAAAPPPPRSSTEYPYVQERGERG